MDHLMSASDRENHRDDERRDETARQHGREFRWIPIDPETCPAGEHPIADEPFPSRHPREINDLVSSVRISGILSPIIVRIVDGRYQIVSGYRRYLAARAAGLREIPALVADMEDAAAIRCYLSCKILRSPLPIDEQNRVLKLLKDLRDGILSRPTPRKPGKEPEEAATDAAELEAEADVASEGRVETGRVETTETTETSEMTVPRFARSPVWRVEGSSRGVADELRARTELLDGPTSMDDHEVSQGFLPGTRRSLYATSAAERSEGDRVAGDLLRRTQGLFLEIQATRSISVARTEELVDLLLARLNGAVPMDLRRLYTGISADIVPAHSLLSAALSAHVARCLGWNVESFRNLVLAGLLHDIGMVFVPGEALKAPRLLTDEERAEVQSHTRIGYALISGTGGWSEEVALAARDHHERWDGSGYPSGMRGAEVIFPARLVALLDMMAALLGPRPHRNALDRATALGKVSRALELGLFDPSFHFLLKGTFRGARIAGLDAAGCDPARISGDGIPAYDGPRGISVEIEGRLATMRSTDS